MYISVIKKAWDACTEVTISVAALIAINIFFIVPAAAVIKHALTN